MKLSQGFSILSLVCSLFHSLSCFLSHSVTQLLLSHSLSHSVIVVHLSRSFSFCFSHFVLLSHSPLFSLLRLTTHNHIHADHHKQIKPNSHIYVFHSAESRFGFSADFGHSTHFSFSAGFGQPTPIWPLDRFRPFSQIPH